MLYSSLSGKGKVVGICFLVVNILKRFKSGYFIRFLDENGQINTGTNVTKLTNMLMEKGFVQENHYQELEEGIKIYPKDFFSPYDYINCHYNITENSYCVHHFAVSWMSKKEQVKKRIKKQLSKILGPKKMNKIREKIKG